VASARGGLPIVAIGGITEETAPAALAGTADAFRALGPRTLAEVIELGLGRDSRASWPGRLTARSIADFFVEAAWLAHLTPEPFPVPPALGAASFLRALYGFGVSLRTVDALAARHQWPAVRLGERMVRFKSSDIARTIDAHTTTSEGSPP